MHSELKIGDSTILASDGRSTGQPKFEGIALTISVGADAQGQKLFNALAAGGKVTMPLAKTFFSWQFGMLQRTDHHPPMRTGREKHRTFEPATAVAG